MYLIMNPQSIEIQLTIFLTKEKAQQKYLIHSTYLSLPVAFNLW